MGGPLEGIRVLEMANVISGPYAGMLLADLGAEVIKVELPGEGDNFRHWDAEPGALRPQFAAYNRGKKSVTIDVRKEGGKECYLRLAERVDVVLENFRPGTLERMGVGYEQVRRRNPEVIYCSITGMGSRGPERNRPTYDAVVQAKSGLWSQLTDLTDPEPVGPPICDQLAGLYAAYGILAALHRRDRTGRGQRLEVSMLSAGLAFQTNAIADYLMTGAVADKLSRARRSQSYAFVAGDGRPFAVHLSTPHKFWQGLCEAAGRPELLEDPRFRTKGDRIRNYHELRRELAATFRTRPRDEWLARFEQHDVPAGPLHTVAEALEDPQVRHLDMVRTWGEGERAVRLVGFPVEMEGTPLSPGLPPPALGEHTEEILAELGYVPEQIARLREEGAI
jgi:formyl-CoA transferase